MEVVPIAILASSWAGLNVLDYLAREALSVRPILGAILYGVNFIVAFVLGTVSALLIFS